MAKFGKEKMKNNLIELRKDYEEHRSSKQIDQFIQENQEKVKVEKIPYKQFTYITYLSEGGFEIASHKLFDKNETKIVKCHGISQDPQGNYIMVMDYARGGNLRDHLQKNNKKLDLKKKLIQLQSIAGGLQSIHKKGLVHKDFHLL
ncbi:877_t:CDS:2 [Cetraspora pellucida]|uniref:877_t:CDS:1 n=1 Tax=Cetraspora pellucida TaxID=1433469 RepID=A0ACA9LVI9_9GLOM|nr:877_t:CDS:2 [Cetraspora pellucida]